MFSFTTTKFSIKFVDMGQISHTKSTILHSFINRQLFFSSLELTHPLYRTSLVFFYQPIRSKNQNTGYCKARRLISAITGQTMTHCTRIVSGQK